MNLYGYVGNYSDPLGLNSAVADGAAITDPSGAVIGAIIGTAIGIGAWEDWDIYNKLPENAYDPNEPHVPGLPGEDVGYIPPKGDPRAGFRTSI